DNDAINSRKAPEQSDLITLRLQRDRSCRWNSVFHEKNRLDFRAGFDAAANPYPRYRDRRLNVHSEIDHVCDHLNQALPDAVAAWGPQSHIRFAILKNDDGRLVGTRSFTGFQSRRVVGIEVEMAHLVTE